MVQQQGPARLIEAGRDSALAAVRSSAAAAAVPRILLLLLCLAAVIDLRGCQDPQGVF
jgi:hypothetical protein